MFAISPLLSTHIYDTRRETAERSCAGSPPPEPYYARSAVCLCASWPAATRGRNLGHGQAHRPPSGPVHNAVLCFYPIPWISDRVIGRLSETNQ